MKLSSCLSPFRSIHRAVIRTSADLAKQQYRMAGGRETRSASWEVLFGPKSGDERMPPPTQFATDAKLFFWDRCQGWMECYCVVAYGILRIYYRPFPQSNWMPFHWIDTTKGVLCYRTKKLKVYIDTNYSVYRLKLADQITFDTFLQSLLQHRLYRQVQLARYNHGRLRWLPHATAMDVNVASTGAGGLSQNGIPESVQDVCNTERLWSAWDELKATLYLMEAAHQRRNTDKLVTRISTIFKRDDCVRIRQKNGEIRGDEAPMLCRKFVHLAEELYERERIEAEKVYLESQLCRQPIDGRRERAYYPFLDLTMSAASETTEPETEPSKTAASDKGKESPNVERTGNAASSNSDTAATFS